MQKLKDKPFALIGVHVGGSTVAQMKDIVAEFDLRWRTFVDLGNAGTGAIARQWNHIATPTMYLIDHKGVIRRKWLGTPGEKAIDEAIERYLKAAENEGGKALSNL